MDQKTTDVALPTLNFIPDKAADEDKFGSHTRIAKALASVVRTHTDLKVVGLLGSWGSGKSTVIKLVESELKTDKSITPYCFTYDAWLHQNDPPRRSFLETLVHYLNTEELTTKEVRDDWKKRLDKLNGRVEEWEKNVTPSLTPPGRILIWSLFFLPLASQFVGHDWYEKSFTSGRPLIEQLAFPLASFFLALPLLLAIAIYFYWRPAKWPWHCMFWSTHRGKHKDESILSLVMNKEVEKSRHRITRTPDPTTIEFQDIFRSIMKTVAGEKRRFIFIIDNLDRLPEMEAVSMWSTIRSFFLGAEETEHVRKLSNMPTVILPIDEDAVRRMYKVSHGEDAYVLAKSFMDKTFDLTFRVTHPVLSDWNSYLQEQMRAVFGQHLESNWPYIVGSIYEQYASEIIVSGANKKGLEVTPRLINTLVNSIATLWLQWRSEDIAFASIAYYAVHREVIDANIGVEIATPRAGINNHDPDWQQAIAGLHYGVPPADALQILIEPRLRSAISGFNEAEFNELQKVRGHERVLKRVLDNAAAGESVDPNFIFNAVKLIANVALPDQYWANEAWHALHRALPKSGNWKELVPESAEALKILSSHTSSIANYVAIVTGKLNELDETLFTNADFIGPYISIATDLFNLALQNNIQFPGINVTGGPTPYLLAIAGARENLPLMRQFKTGATDADIVQQLATAIADQNQAAHVEPAFRALMEKGDTMPWAALITAATEVIQNQNAKHPGVEAALLCLGLLMNTEKTAKNSAKRCADEGQLATRMTEAHGANKVIAEARAAAMFLLVTSNCPAPGVAWAKAVTDRPDLAVQISSALIEFDNADNLKALVAIASNQAEVLPLIRAIVSQRVDDGKLGELYVNEVIQKLPQYLACVNNGLQDAFLAKFSGYDTFWEELEKQDLLGSAAAILHSLLKDGSDKREQAGDFIRRKLEEVDAVTWQNAIKSNSEPLTLSLAATRIKELQITAHLYDALVAQIEDLISSSDEKFIGRWFGAAQLVSLSSRRSLFQTIRDRINSGSAVSALLELLRSGGAAFLADGGFAQEPDKAIRYAILQLCNQPDGVAWLSSNEEQLKSWVSASGHDMQIVLSERIHERITSTDGETQAQLEQLKAAWNLPDLPSENDTEADSEEKEAP